MSDNSFKKIRDGVIISVLASIISGVALIFIPALRGYVANFFSWLWSCLVWCWEALTSSYSLPGWVLVLFFLCFLIVISQILFAIKKGAKEPGHKFYIEDFMYGAKWRWKWIGNQLSNVWCFCPVCDATLVSVYYSFSFDKAEHIKFMCENCGRVVATITGNSSDYAVRVITREIGRRIRTGEYKDNK